MEKEFKELIKEFEKDVTDDYWETPDGTYYLGKLSQLLQQVREATIRECYRIHLQYTDCGMIEFNEMPTDRIKIKD